MGLRADQRYKIPRCCCCRKTALPGCSSPFAWVIENKTRQRKEYSPGKVLPGSWENANGPNRSLPSLASLDSVMILSGTLQSTCVSTHALTKVLEMNRAEPKPVWERLRELWVWCYMGRAFCISSVHVFSQTRKKILLVLTVCCTFLWIPTGHGICSSFPAVQGPILLQKRAHFLSACVQFNLGFVSTTSLQKISNWKQCSEWKKTLPLCTGMTQRWPGSRQGGTWSTDGIGTCSICTSPSWVASFCGAQQGTGILCLHLWLHLQALWHRGEPAELDDGHGLGQGLFPQTKMPLSAVPAAVCSCGWHSPQATPHAHTVGQRGIRRQGREESSIQRHKMPKNILIVTHLLHAVLCLLHSFSTVVTLHPQ